MDVVDSDCIIIGAGVAGLSIARQLAPNLKNIFLIEKNKFIGQEASSRNSEVIHAGIYYDKGSLKHELSVKGKPILYEYLKSRNLPFNNCGKYIISTSKKESEKLYNIKQNAEECGVEDLYLDTKCFRDRYPFIKSDEAIFSPSSGIFDSHAYLSSLASDFEQDGGHVILNNECKGFDFSNKLFEILVSDNNSGSDYLIRTKILINSAGLNAVDIYDHYPNSFKNKFRQLLIKGDYYSYSGKEKIDNLIYPLPEENGLGVHATIDMGGGIRFGPSSYLVDDIEYGMESKNKIFIINSIQKYWPNIDRNLLNPSYSGIRSKLVGVNDFTIVKEEMNGNIFLSVLGYESPGLTASLALGEYSQKFIFNN